MGTKIIVRRRMKLHCSEIIEKYSQHSGPLVGETFLPLEESMYNVLPFSPGKKQRHRVYQALIYIIHQFVHHNARPTDATMCHNKILDFVPGRLQSDWHYADSIIRHIIVGHPEEND